MKKANRDLRDLIYVHLHEKDQYVLSYGIQFFEFYQALSNPLSNMLLLKHRFDDGEFNMHTLLEYVPEEKVAKIVRDDVYGYGDFCWIDFFDKDSIDQLLGQEIAELLYLGHTKQHLRPPFYNRLHNRFVYLAHDDGWFNKTYYRNIMDFFEMVGVAIANKMGVVKPEKSFLGLRKNRAFPIIPKELTLILKSAMKEGMVIAFNKMTQTRSRMDIPIWIVGDFDNMDDMYEEFDSESKREYDGKLVFDRKTREWKIYVK